MPMSTGAMDRGGAWRRWLAILGIAGLLTVLLSAALVRPVNAQEMLEIDAGYGTGTVAGQAFGPGAPTILVGDSLKFTVTSDEVHTITFGPGPADMPPGQWPVAGWTAPAGPPPWDFGAVETDGTEHLNTGIAPTGSTATVTFTAAGSFPFFCAIHPGMDGEVEVLESGPAMTQAEADQASMQTSDELLGQVDALREDRLAQAAQEGTTWNVFADATTEPGPMPGGGSGYLELLEFSPDMIAIAAGDTVSWTADAVHTVTFVPDGTDPTTLDPFGTPPSGDGGDYTGTEIANSGVFNAGPQAPTSFSLTFPEEGTFPFYCLLHQGLGQVGEVVVGELPPTDLIDPSSPPAGSPWTGLLAVAAVAVAAAWLIRREQRETAS